MKLPILLLTTLPLMTSCENNEVSADEMKNKVQSNLEQAAEWTKDKWNAFTEKSSEQLDELDADLKKLRDEAGEGSNEALDRAKKAYDSAKRELDELSDSAADSWDSSKEKISKSLKEARSRLEEAAKAIRGDR